MSRTTPALTPRSFTTNFGEFIGIGENGNLWVEDCDVADLARRFGTPLFIISESQLRYTYRQFRDAFRRHYPDVEILFANKSNNGLAIRHIMNQEGAGGDCFGVNEMYLALLAGTDPTTLVLNGSNKQTEELEMAIQNGLCINIDAEDELERIEAICRRFSVRADIGIRLKLDLEPLRDHPGVAMHGPGTMKQQSDSTKWGMSRAQTVAIVKAAQASGHLRLKETHFHLSRMSNEAADFAVIKIGNQRIEFTVDTLTNTNGRGPADGRTRGADGFVDRVDDDLHVRIVAAAYDKGLAFTRGQIGSGTLDAGH